VLDFSICKFYLPSTDHNLYPGIPEPAPTKLEYSSYSSYLFYRRPVCVAWLICLSSPLLSSPLLSSAIISPSFYIYLPTYLPTYLPASRPFGRHCWLHFVFGIPVTPVPFHSLGRCVRDG
jgi:hypothetical protein